MPASIQAAASESEPVSGSSVLVGNMDEIQKQAILEALETTGGNKTQAARLLGISRRTRLHYPGIGSSRENPRPDCERAAVSYE